MLLLLITVSHNKEKIHNKGYIAEKRHSRDEQKTNEEIHIGGYIILYYTREQKIRTAWVPTRFVVGWPDKWNGILGK